MIQQFSNSMLILVLAKFVLNDVPHALGAMKKENGSHGLEVWYHATRLETYEFHARLYGLRPQLLDERYNYIPGRRGLFIGTEGICEQYMEITSYGNLEMYERSMSGAASPPYVWMLLEVLVPNNIRYYEDVDFEGSPEARIITEPIPAKRIKPVRKYKFENEKDGLVRM